MASSTVQNLLFGLNPKSSFPNSPTHSYSSSVKLGFDAVSQISSLLSSAKKNVNNNTHILKKLKHSSRASAAAEEIPSELIEDSKFVPLNADDPTYGPPALLLLGFELEEASKIQQLLKDMDGEFLKVIYCTEDMVTRSLWEAVHTKQPNLENVKIAKSSPRICFLSGLTGEETMMFIDAFEESGLEPTVFAALVPNSADKPLQELIEEIMGDHEMMLQNLDLREIWIFRTSLFQHGRRRDGFLAEMGWDPKVWEDPMEFKPERFLNSGNGGGGSNAGDVFDISCSREIKMMPFGAGRRICPGSGLAMLHLEYFVANLVRCFKWTAAAAENGSIPQISAAAAAEIWQNSHPQNYWSYRFSSATAAGIK